MHLKNELLKLIKLLGEADSASGGDRLTWPADQAAPAGLHKTPLKVSMVVVDDYCF